MAANVNGAPPDGRRGQVGSSSSQHGFGIASSSGSGSGVNASSRSVTPGFSSAGAGSFHMGPSDFPSLRQNAGPTASQPTPTSYPRFTSPPPRELLNRSPSPSKRAAQYGGGVASDARDRWAAVGERKQQQAGPSSRQFDGSSQLYGGGPSSGEPSEGLLAGNRNAAYPDLFSGAGQTSFDNRGYPIPPGGDDIGRFDSAGYRDGPMNGHFAPAGLRSTLPASGSLSPRSLLQFHHQQLQAQQQMAMQAAQQPGMPPPPLPHFAPAAHNLGSGLMSNSGQPAEEITTVFIVGFPDDMTEREFANMFLFARGFEASTLKVPAGGMGPTFREAGGQIGSAYDMGPAGGPGGWEEHAMNMNLGPNSATRDSFAAAAAGGIGGPAGKIKQIIGFAKFRTRAEALDARDALNGKKIDLDRGCILKTEMAKKNLHTKQRPVLAAPPQQSQSQMDGSVFGGPMGPPPPGSQHFPPLGHDRNMAGPSLMPNSAGGPRSFAPSYTSEGSQPYDSYDRASITSGGGSSSMNSYPDQDRFGMPSQDFGGSRRAADKDTQGEMTFGTSSGSAPGGPLTVKTPSDFSASIRGGGGDKWASAMGPLDFFGGGDETPQQAPPPASSSSQHSSSQRGPDWSAVASPPGLFNSARSFGSQQENSRSRGYSITSPTKSSPEDSMKERIVGSTSAAGGGSTSQSGNSPMKPGASFASDQAVVGKRSGDEARPLSASPNSASPPETSTTTSPATTTTTFGGSGFASRFGSLRLDTIEDKETSGSSKEKEPTSSKDSKTSSMSRTSTSGGLRSPGSSSDLASPTSRSFSIDQNPPGNTLFVGNLPGSLSPSASSSLEDQLRGRFSPCSGFRQLSYRLKNNGPMCFVEFDDVPSASRALVECNGDTLNGAVKNGGLRLSYSKNPLFRMGRDSGSSGSTPPGQSSSSTESNSIGGVVAAAAAASRSPVLAATTTQASTGSGFTSLGKIGESLLPTSDPLDSTLSLESTSYQSGFDSGSAHGKLHGLFEGRALGREKGFEIWEEVGRYEGMIGFWRAILLKQQEKDSGGSSRKRQKQLVNLDQLQRLIDVFPMRNNSGAAAATASTDVKPSTPTSIDNGEEEDDLDTLRQLDMSTLLERIRARYKLVCSSLGVSSTSSLKASSSTMTNEDGDDLQGTSGTSTPKGSAVIHGRVVDTKQLTF